MSTQTNTYRKFDKLDLPTMEREVLKYWEENQIFQKSIDKRTGATPYVFYEGPPSANGKPGIHHVMGRTIKDIFCRYKTMQGYQVSRKGGWDTHGLPIELSVEKSLNITKEDIGTKITVEEYNKACRTEVMKYKDMWDDITVKMGYWVDLDNPYITFKNEYIETLWYLIKQLYEKDYLYKGYTIQPYSPAAGTGLSSHELNQPGTYKDVKDTTVTAQFKIKGTDNEYFLAWTTTPWTLPSNTALAVGKNIDYVKVKTYNQYTHLPIVVFLAKDLLSKHFKVENAELPFEEYEAGQKNIPYQIISEHKGSDFEGTVYEQLLPYVLPNDHPEKAFRVILGDFVTTEDGTGIVHIAPTFGADDARVAKKAGIPPMLIMDKNGNLVPLVDLQGRFVEQMGDLGGKFVKNEYYSENAPQKSIDVEIAIKLKEENKAFKVEKYQHNYPHCWRTDKPILYYPLDSWFIAVSKSKDRMVELNKTINWKPKSTGEGRFGNWLENLQDWNLSRSRFWGTPLPIWRTEDGTEEKCIGSIAELRTEVEKAVTAGFMDGPLANDFELHKPYVDDVYLVSDTGQKMWREADLIDVWFDSGAMPYAQWHYPFENQETFKANFPADFIAEGVDQTRGWFYTLHAIAVMLFDSVAYKNVVSNGLLQDKNGQKMSKRLGNTVDPFDTIENYGADAARWYMISNSPPWDNLKFDIEGLKETRRKFFGTLYNTYSFFAMYANLDGFVFDEKKLIPVAERSEIDRWVISKLNTLVKEVTESIDDYEATRAARKIQSFVEDHLSNWFVRLSRKRYWKQSNSEDKQSAYQTLYTCLETVVRLMAPISPFMSDLLYQALHQNQNSVHWSSYPSVNEGLIDENLEERMDLAQKFSSMVLALRKKVKIKVRQPLQRILIPVVDEHIGVQIKAVESLILNETNVKSLEYVDANSDIFTKSIKPNFKVLGKKLGPLMKSVQSLLSTFSQADIDAFEQAKELKTQIGDQAIVLTLEDVIISTEDIPGWLVNTESGFTVALDTTISDDLKKEGYAREIVNKIQRLRKEMDLEVTDKISLTIVKNAVLEETILFYKEYICSETLTEYIDMVEDLSGAISLEINDVQLDISINKV